MTHCQNYVCKLRSGCACRCDSCLSQKQELAKTCPNCGACPYCGRTDTPPVYIPYPVYPQIPYTPGWYCTQCMMYHPYGYQCIRYIPAQPYIYTNPTIYTLDNFPICNPNVTLTGGTFTSNIGDYMGGTHTQ